jgi:hypothetical protein
MRYLPCVLGVSLLVAAPAYAEPPARGYVGAIVYRNGQEPLRFACDTLDLVKTIYAAGKDNLFLMRAKFDELAATEGIHREPQCLLGRYGRIRVGETPVLLGPIVNPVGNARLFFWAVHVDNSPKGGTADYWILYLDTMDETELPGTEA